jgi:hypothetical protein
MYENGPSSGLVTAWVAMVVAVLLAIGFFVNGTIERHQAREVRVFDLSKEYRVSLRQTNAQFSYRWNEYLTDSVDPYNGGNLDEQAYTDLVNRFLAADSNRESYEALAGFYDTVGECVREKLCDFWFARAVFGQDIVTFYHNFYPALDAENSQGQSDQGIVDFANRMRQADRGQIDHDWNERVAAWAQ